LILSLLKFRGLATVTRVPIAGRPGKVHHVALIIGTYRLDKEQMDHRMTMRRMPFTYAKHANAHWNKDKPEFSQIVNAAAMAMPYLEPYLIRSMRRARLQITDPVLFRWSI